MQRANPGQDMADSVPVARMSEGKRTPNPPAMPITYGMKVQFLHCETGKMLHPTKPLPFGWGKCSTQKMVSCVDQGDYRKSPDWWFFKPDSGHAKDKRTLVKNGDIIRLEHVHSHYNLHSHYHKLYYKKDHHEVTCFERWDQGDGNDDWRVVCNGVVEFGKPFQLIHVGTNAALHSHNVDYPCFHKEQQVTGCPHPAYIHDNNVFWKISEHTLHTALHMALLFIDQSTNDEVHVEEEIFFAILRSCPKAAQVRDPDGRLPLSICLNNGGTEEYTAALIDAYPEARRDPEIASLLYSKATSLHLAMENNVPLETVTDLLSTDPESALQRNYTGETPLQFGLRFGAPAPILAVLARNSDAARLPWKAWKHFALPCSGMSPLGYAMMTNASSDVVLSLLEAYPQAVIEADEFQKYPLHYGVENHQDAQIITVVTGLRSKFNVGPLCDGNSNTPLHLAMRHNRPLEVVQALLTFPHDSEVPDDSGNLPLHVGMAANASVESIKAVLYSYKGAAATRNKRGETPLHVGMKSQARDEAIAIVLEAHPRAASMEAPDGGETPLELGVKHNASKYAMAIVLHAYPRAARRLSEEEVEAMKELGILTRHEMGRAFADRPNGEDKLGASRLARAVVDIHTRKIEDAMLPSNIAVYAEWGSGKSFVKNKMREAFNAVNFEDRNKHYRFVQLEFNAWVYNGGDSIWAALVNRLIDGITSISKPQEFQAHMNDVDLWLLKMKRYVLYFLASAAFLGLVIVAFVFAFGGIGPEIQNVVGFTIGLAAFGAIGSSAVSVGKVWGQVQKPVSEILFGKPKDPHYTAELGLMGDVKEKFAKMLGFLEIQNREAEDRRRKFLKTHLLALRKLKMAKYREVWRKQKLSPQTEENIRRYVKLLACSEDQLKGHLLSLMISEIREDDSVHEPTAVIRSHLVALMSSETKLREHIQTLAMSEIRKLAQLNSWLSMWAARDIERHIVELKFSEPDIQEHLVTLIISKIRNECNECKFELSENVVKDIQGHLEAIISSGTELKEKALELSTIRKVIPKSTRGKLKSGVNVKEHLLSLIISKIQTNCLEDWEEDDIRLVVDLMTYKKDLHKTEIIENRARFMRLLRAFAHGSESNAATASSRSATVIRVDRDTQDAIKAAEQSRRALEEVEKMLFTEEERHPKLPLDCRSVRFVIYVDDLDRCSNGKSVEILEAVQLLFNEVAPAMASAGSMTEFPGWMRLSARLLWHWRQLCSCFPSARCPCCLCVTQRCSWLHNASPRCTACCYTPQPSIDTYDVERDDVLRTDEQSDKKPPFITIFMIDPRIVVQDIMVRFGSTLKQAGINGYQFLDKIVQTPICLPKPAERPRQHMLSHLMSGYLSIETSDFTTSDETEAPRDSTKDKASHLREEVSSPRPGGHSTILETPPFEQKELHLDDTLTAVNPTFQDQHEADDDQTDTATADIAASIAAPAEEESEGEDEDNEVVAKVSDTAGSFPSEPRHGPNAETSADVGEEAQASRLGVNTTFAEMPPIEQKELHDSSTAVNPAILFEADDDQTITTGSTWAINAALAEEERAHEEAVHNRPINALLETLDDGAGDRAFLRNAAPYQAPIVNEGTATLADATTEHLITSEPRDNDAAPEKISHNGSTSAVNDRAQAVDASFPITNIPKDGFDAFERENVNAHATYLDANPRRIKRILNIYNYTREIYQSIRNSASSASADVAPINEELELYMSAMGLTSNVAMKQRFLRVLFRWITMSEQWPFRTTLTVQMMSDDAQRPGGREQLYGGREQTVAWQSKWVRAERHDQSYLIRLGPRVEYEHTTSEGLFQERLQRFESVIAACTSQLDPTADECAPQWQRRDPVRIELLDKITLAVVSVTTRSHDHPILKCLRERMPAQLGVLRSVVQRQRQQDSAFGIDVSKLSIESHDQLIDIHCKLTSPSTTPSEARHSIAHLNTVMVELFPHVSKAIDIPLKQFFVHEVQHYVYKFSESVDLKSTTEADADVLTREFNELASLDSDPEVFDAILAAPFQPPASDLRLKRCPAEMAASNGTPGSAPPGLLERRYAAKIMGAQRVRAASLGASEQGAREEATEVDATTLQDGQEDCEQADAAQTAVHLVAASSPDPYRPITLEECYFLAQHFSFNLNPAILSSLQRLIRGRPHYDKGRNEFRKRGAVELFDNVGSL